MNITSHINSQPNRYRSAPIWWRIIVRCKFTINNLQKCSVELRLYARTVYQSSAIIKQLHSVVTETARNNYQIPIGRHPF